MSITNFATVGFTKTIGVEYRSNKMWKIIQVYCLGVLVCDKENCQWVGSPPTGKDGIAKLLDSYIVLLPFWLNPVA
jgi:hypothetical protein